MNATDRKRLGLAGPPPPQTVQQLIDRLYDAAQTPEEERVLAWLLRDALRG